jgi:hypothetical protein
MLTLQDELWLANNAPTLCFNTHAHVLTKTEGMSKARIFLELMSHTDALHADLIKSTQITAEESNAIKQCLTDYLKVTRF